MNKAMDKPVDKAQHARGIISQYGFEAATEYLLKLPEKDVLAEPVIDLFLHCLENIEHEIDNEKAARILEQAIRDDLFKLNSIVKILNYKIKQKPIFDYDIFSVPQLRIVMRYKVIALRGFEYALIKARNRILLKTLEEGGFSAETEEKIFLIAIQQYHKEYATPISDGERDILIQIKSLIENRIAEKETLVSVSVYLYLYAMYEDPATIEGLKGQSFEGFPGGIKTILHLSCEFPDTIKEMAKTIPLATPISEGASEIVRAQYEENPYPRWQTIGYSASNSPKEFYKLFDPYMAENQSLPVPNDVLVAGCGTGQHPITIAQCLPSSNIVAVDLSLNSLGYAKYKAKEHRIKNITFLQADIMNIGHLNQKFDLIECGGVLHHLAEPEKGLELLLQVLKPKGCIRIGVYSTLARKKLLEDQSLVSKNNIKPTLDNIRQYRVDRLVKSDGTMSNCPSTFADFYSTSMCRDLIFHTHEKTYSWLEVQTLVDQAGLVITGVEVTDKAKRAFEKMYPSAESWLDTACWDTFEESNPDAFRTMMRFYARRKDAP